MSPDREHLLGTSRRPWPSAKDDPQGHIQGRSELDANGCWVWTGPILTDRWGAQYGRTHIGNNRGMLAHRLSWEAFSGKEIPAGLQIDHLCGNSLCVNPHHLEPVTQLENQRRSSKTKSNIERAKTHCPQGHEYTPENTSVRQKPGRPDGSMGRWCKACAAEKGREAHLRKVAVDCEACEWSGRRVRTADVYAPCARCGGTVQAREFKRKTA